MPLIQGPRCNRRVTCDPNPTNDRSECSIAMNPKDPRNMIAASKRFTDPHKYQFSLAAYTTFDNGQSWSETDNLELLQGWAGTSDPVVTFDYFGNAYLVGLPFGFAQDGGNEIVTLGIAVYKSSDGGLSWGGPRWLDPNKGQLNFGDDKPWVAADFNDNSPHKGNVYIVWQDLEPGTIKVRFARTADQGQEWGGIQTQVDPNKPIVIDLRFPAINADQFAHFPQIFVDDAGAVYIIWIKSDDNQSASIRFVKSLDGGNTFSDPKDVATGIQPLPELIPGSLFREATFPTGCAGKGSNLLIAWADFRLKKSRIFGQHSTDGGAHWGNNTPYGVPLLDLGIESPGDRHDLFPQLARTPNGEIGCAFYELTPGVVTQNLDGSMNSTATIDVCLAVSTSDSNGLLFKDRVTVTEQSWRADVDAPYAEGNVKVEFIGDYFGLTASKLGFFPLWTDTRTGVQELYCSRLSIDPGGVSISYHLEPNPGHKPIGKLDAVIRLQPDGDKNFVYQRPVFGQESYVYARAFNDTAVVARNVTMTAIVRHKNPAVFYPQDFYQGDWVESKSHRFLGELSGIDMESGMPSRNMDPGQRNLFGPFLWPASAIPYNSKNQYVLIEARCDNDDSLGGNEGMCVPAFFPGQCPYTSDPSFYGNVAILDATLMDSMKLDYPGQAYMSYPFEIGSPYGPSSFTELFIDKGEELANVTMSLKVEQVDVRGRARRQNAPGVAEIVLLDGGRVTIRQDGREVTELVAAPGTVFQATNSTLPRNRDYVAGGSRVGPEWRLDQRRSALGFSMSAGEVRLMTLGFAEPSETANRKHTFIRISQRTNRKVMRKAITLRVEASRH